jgi:hypothetical protein
LKEQWNGGAEVEVFWAANDSLLNGQLISPCYTSASTSEQAGFDSRKKTEFA